jgi:hypothetical protein
VHTEQPVDPNQITTVTDQLAYAEDFHCVQRLRTDHMVTPRKIRVRLRWEDGHIDTLPEPINSNKFELKQQDSTGAWHSSDDANEVDEEGYLIFAQVD